MEKKETTTANQGFIKINRQILEWEWYDDINTFKLFMHILLRTYYKTTKWRGNSYARGSFPIGRKDLSKETGLSQQQVRTSLSKLKSTNEITIKATSKFSIITIVNYDKFQNINQPSNQQVTNNQPANQPTSNQQVTTIKEYKEIKEVKNKREKLKKPTLEQIELYLKEKNITSFTAEKFYFYYEANGWMIGKNKMKSWKGAIGSWNAKTKENLGENNNTIEDKYDYKKLREDNPHYQGLANYMINDLENEKGGVK